MKFLLFLLFIPTVAALGVSPPTINLEETQTLYVINEEDEEITVIILEEKYVIPPRERLSFIVEEPGNLLIKQEGRLPAITVPVHGKTERFKGIIPIILINIFVIVGGIIAWKKNIFSSLL